MATDLERIHNVKHLLRTLLLKLSVDPSIKEQLDATQMKKSLADILGSIMQVFADLGMERGEVFQQIEENLTTKKQFERFQEYSEELARFLSRGFKVVHGTPKDMVKQLSEIVAHAEDLWSVALLLFEQKHFAIACFLSLVCIEECAKISFGEFQLYDRVMSPSISIDGRPLGKNPLTSHVKKHFLAACSGALVNSRMDRILGTDKVNSFIEDCKAGKLEKLRQACLYADHSASGIMRTPASQITKEQSFFYTCLAGELLAEVEGAESTRGQFLERLNKFEEEGL